MHMQTPDTILKSSYTPSSTLRRFCYALINPECRGMKTIAQAKSGVSKLQFYKAWKKSTEFRKWYTELSDQFLKLNRPIVDNALMKKIKEGNVTAMRTYYEVEQKITSAGVNVKITNIENNIFMDLQTKTDDELRELTNRARSHSLN